jgi:hypothetical protein
MGDFLAAINQTVEDGPYKGRNIVNADGNYVMSQDYEFVGNAMPKVVGGLGITVAYKRFISRLFTISGCHTIHQWQTGVILPFYPYTTVTGFLHTVDHLSTSGLQVMPVKT